MQPFDSSCDDDIGTTETTALRRRRPFKKERSGVRSSSVFLPRFVKRNLPFHQSRNNVRVKNVNSKKLWKLWAIDWFHSLLRLPSHISIPCLLSFWVTFVVIFAAIYMHVDQLDAQTDCGLGDVGSPIGFPGAFAFSLETCTTVGYGLPGSTNGFFEQDCGMLQMTIFVQMLWSMMFNAFLFAFFYSLLSKSEFRSSQIVFTSKLIINQKGGKVFARLQCFDIDSAYPLVDAHARMFLLDSKMKMTPLRLCDPDDERGAAIYPSVPADIVHHIDHHSPLSPRHLPFVRKASVLALRSLDSYTCNREEVICPVCGEGYGTYERLKAHVEYTAMVDERENFPKEKSHAGFVVPEIEPLTLDEVREHIEKALSEIVVVIEAVDPQLSGGFQSLQSYKYDDIEFGCEFSDCILSQRNDSFVVDMEKFHGLVYRSDCNGNSQDSQKLLQREDSSASLSTISEGSSEPATAQRGYLRRSYNTFQSASERIKEFTSNALDKHL